MAVEVDVDRAPRDHVVQFYRRDEELVDRVGLHLAEALRTGKVAIVVATSEHTEALETLLAGAGIDVVSARVDGRLISLDAAAALSRFMVDGHPDPEGFEAVIGATVRAAAGTGRAVTTFGEMVGLLWDAGNVQAAIEVEGMWNELGRELPFTLWCAYRAEADCGEAFSEVCRMHSGVVDRSEHRVAEHDTRSFDRSLHAARAARQFVADVLHRWGRGDYVDDAVLIVSELTTNAIVHAKSSPSVSVSAGTGTVRISVRDAQPALVPRVAHPTPTSPSGRGLALVAGLASAWGSERADEGKVVWAELRR